MFSPVVWAWAPTLSADMHTRVERKAPSFMPGTSYVRRGTPLIKFRHSSAVDRKFECGSGLGPQNGGSARRTCGTRCPARGRSAAHGVARRGRAVARRAATGGTRAQARDRVQVTALATTPGNRSSFCRNEEDFTLDLGRDVKRELEATGRFEVRLSRGPGELVDYKSRIEAAATCGARAFVSLHSDVRGHAELWKPGAGLECPRHRGGTGFAVLFSDSVAPGEASRERLASAIAGEVADAGFVPFQGVEYAADYRARPTPGVFVDRHAEGERIFVLRVFDGPRRDRSETHNALDDREALAWEDPEARRVFSRALSRALASAL